jgi:hypothetical protein
MDPSDESQCVVTGRRSRSFTTRLLQTAEAKQKQTAFLLKKREEKEKVFSGRAGSAKGRLRTGG